MSADRATVGASCLYEGTIRHRRFAVRRREFTHRIALAYVDLEELPTLLGGQLVDRQPGLVRVRRRDYHGEPTVPLADSVRETVRRQTGWRPDGPIRMLAHPRVLGHCFNPLSLYYCLDATGERLRAVLAEVTNTPWGERHAYVLQGAERDGPLLRAEFAKRLHVSPFIGMAYSYRARLTVPARTLSVHIECRAGERLDFDATLGLRRLELTRRSARRLALRYPFATVRVLALIYWHALGLRLAGVPAHPHPSRGRP